MHVLYVLHALPWNETTGTTLVFDNYVKEALRIGVGVSVIVPESAYINLHNNSYGDHVRVYSYKSQDNWGISGFDLVESKKRIEGPTLEPLPDVVHIINWVNFHPSIFNFLKSLGKPILRSVCNFEEFCPMNTPIFYNNNLSPCKLPLDVEQCLSCVSDNTRLNVPGATYTYKFLLRDLIAYRDNYRNSIDELMNGRDRFVKSIYNEFVDFVVFPSLSFGKYFLEQLRENVSFKVVPHGLDRRNSFNNGKLINPIKIVYTGGDRLAKGWDVMASAIDILSRTPNHNFEIYFVGNTGSIPDAYFENKNIRLVRFSQYPRSQTYEFLSQFDIAIAPSHFESYGIFVRECVASGVVPIVISALGVDDFVINGVNGYLLQEPFAHNLADLIKRLTDKPQVIAELKSNLASGHVPTIDEEFATLHELYKELSSYGVAPC